MSYHLKIKEIKHLFQSITPTVEIKSFNVLIDGKRFFVILIKKEAHKKIIEMSKTNDYTTGNLFDCEYFLKHYELIAIDLGKQIVLENLYLK